MKILVVSLNPKFKKEGSTHVSRVSTFQDDDPEFIKLTERLNAPFYVLKLNKKLERDHFVKFLEELRNIPVKEILDAEAIKYIKKKYDGEYKFIVDCIVAVS